MKNDAPPQPAGRSETGRFLPGVSGNPAGKPKSLKDFEALCRERTPQAITRLLEIGKGKGVAAVKALEIIVAYAYGRPATTTSVHVTASRGPDASGGNPDQARQRLEALIAAEKGGATDTETVALPANPESVPVVGSEGGPASPSAAPRRTGGEP